MENVDDRPATRRTATMPPKKVRMTLYLDAVVIDAYRTRGAHQISTLDKRNVETGG
jgi:hypothetical protein